MTTVCASARKSCASVRLQCRLVDSLHGWYRRAPTKGSAKPVSALGPDDQNVVQRIMSASASLVVCVGASSSFWWPSNWFPSDQCHIRAYVLPNRRMPLLTSTYFDQSYVSLCAALGCATNQDAISDSVCGLNPAEPPRRARSKNQPISICRELWSPRRPMRVRGC
jgi:hypothetical protein